MCLSRCLIHKIFMIIKVYNIPWLQNIHWTRLHCVEFELAGDGRKGVGPRLIVGAIEGKLIVGGAVGSPERGAAPVISGALSEGVACAVGGGC